MAAPMPAPAAAPMAIPAMGKTTNSRPPIRPPTTAPASVALLASFLTSNEPSALWVTTAVSSKWIPPCFSTPRRVASASRAWSSVSKLMTTIRLMSCSRSNSMGLEFTVDRSLHSSASNP